MSFGKFKVSEYAIGAVALVVILFIILHFTLEEEKLKEQTKQLEIQKQIVEIDNKKEVD